MQQQGGFAGGRWALEALAHHADHRGTTLEPWEHVAQRRRAGDRVELVAACDQAGRGGRVQVRAEGHHQDVCLESAGRGLHPAGLRIERADLGLDEAHARLRNLSVGVTHRVRRLPAEHHIQFGEAEDEGVVLVDEHEVERVAEPLREDGCQFQAAKAGPQHHDACRHEATRIAAWAGRRSLDHHRLHNAADRLKSIAALGDQALLFQKALRSHRVDGRIIEPHSSQQRGQRPAVPHVQQAGGRAAFPSGADHGPQSAREIPAGASGDAENA